MAAVARDVIDTILGEAGGKTIGQRYNDMLHVASTMVNRAMATRQSLQSIVSAPGQYDAFGKALPKGTEKLRAIAERALQQVLTSGPVTNATYMATPAAAKNLPKGLQQVTQTQSHVYSVDPANRAIATSQGYISPASALGLPGTAPTPTARPAVDTAALSSYASSAPSNSARQALDTLAGASPAQDVSFSSPLGKIGDRVTSPFGTRSQPKAGASVNHKGVDLTAALGQGQTGYAVQTAAPGVVTAAGPVGGYGNMVEVTHPNGFTTRYGHLGAINVSVGDVIAGGAPIGTVGNTGNSTGAHLHFEVRDPTGKAIDPRSMVDFNSKASVPTPTTRPGAPGMPSMSISHYAPQSVPARSVQTTRFSPPADAVPSAPNTDNIGYFGGQAGSFASMPARSVQTVATDPSGNLSSAVADASKADTFAGLSPEAGFFGGTAGAAAGVPAKAAKSISITPENAATALSDLATRTKDDAITEIAGAPVGQSAVAPSNTYATTNLPGYGYTPPSVTAMAPEPVAPAPIEVAPPAAITPPSPVFTPQTVAPAPAPARAAAAPSIPSGTKAALDFHAGLNNAAVASNGNTLTRDAMGYSYNYSPEFDVTTISNPAGDTVGVKQGKVTADSAGVSTSPSGGLLDGLGKALGGIGGSLGGIFSGNSLSKDSLSNAVVGGLGGLGGAAVGGLLGPVGSVIGSAIGRQLAIQHNPFATAQPGMFTINTFDGPMSFASPVGGLGFPSAPSLAGALGGTQSNRSRGDMRGISPRAADAIGKGQGGLY